MVTQKLCLIFIIIFQSKIATIRKWQFNGLIGSLLMPFATCKNCLIISKFPVRFDGIGLRNCPFSVILLLVDKLDVDFEFVITS